MWIVTESDGTSPYSGVGVTHTLCSDGVTRGGKYRTVFPSRDAARVAKRALSKAFPSSNYQIWKITPVR